jgi:hypothetical protein
MKYEVVSWSIIAEFVVLLAVTILGVAFLSNLKEKKSGH